MCKDIIIKYVYTNSHVNWYKQTTQ